MEDFLLIVLKLATGFVTLILTINLTGKGNLAPSSASDQIQNYVLGGIIGGVLFNKSIQITTYLLVLGSWFALVMGLKWLKTNNVAIKQLLDGKALIVIENGQIQQQNCRRVGLTAHDLSFRLRTQNIYSIKKVKRAIVEQNGQLIITLEGDENPKFPLITDGQLQEDILRVIGKDFEWLQTALQQAGYHSHAAIFLGEYQDGELILIPYNRTQDVV